MDIRVQNDLQFAYSGLKYIRKRIMDTNIVVHTGGTLMFQNKQYHCALGRGGLRGDKHEDDGATPVGKFLLRKMYYRPDKFKSVPQTLLPVVPLSSDDGWSDDVTLPEYNTFVKLPYAGSHERLWRADNMYDIVIPLGLQR